jgi:hypothetical protein
MLELAGVGMGKAAYGRNPGLRHSDDVHSPPLQDQVLWEAPSRRHSVVTPGRLPFGQLKMAASKEMADLRFSPARPPKAWASSQTQICFVLYRYGQLQKLGELNCQVRLPSMKHHLRLYLGLASL